VGTPFTRTVSTLSKTADTKNFELVLSQRERELEQQQSNNPNANNDDDEDYEDDDDDDAENMLKNALRRQSLFNLKDRLNGKVSRHINEIEQRKLSPYRFCNSPLKKSKKSKDASGTATPTGHVSKKHVPSPLRLVPSFFGGSKRATAAAAAATTVNLETPTEQYVINPKSKYISENKLSKTIATCILERKAKSGSKMSSGGGDNSPLIVRAANQIYRKMNRNRSVKRLNQTTLSSYTARSNLSAISETSSTRATNVSMASSYAYPSLSNVAAVTNTTGFSSPTSPRPHFLFSTELKCSTESIDL
jgi:hypothetical protein